MAADYVPRSGPTYATPADLLENLGATLAEQFALAETVMIRRVARALQDTMTLEGAEFAQARAAVLADLRAQGVRIADDLLAPGLADRILAVAAQEGRAAAAALLVSVGLPTSSGVTPAAARAVASIALDLTSELDRMRSRIVRWMPDVYQQTIGLVAPTVITGTATLQEAQRGAASRLLARGVPGFIDRSGRSWRIGTYAEMATRTAVQRAWIDAHANEMLDSAAINLCSIVGGVDVCSRCAPHVGRIYSLDGTPAGTITLEHATQNRLVQVTVAGTLDQARAAGWGHPNCRCTIAGYLPGLSIAAGSTYDPAAEADRDRLRALERHVRDWKRREAAALDDLEAAAARRKVRQWQGQIREHVASTGQVRKSYREQLGFSDGAAPATPRPRPAALAAPQR